MSDETNGAQCVVPDCPEEPTVRLYYCPVHAQEPLRPTYEDGVRDAARVVREGCPDTPEWSDRKLWLNRAAEAVLGLLSDTPTAPERETEPLDLDRLADEAEYSQGWRDAMATAPAAVPVERLREVLSGDDFAKGKLQDVAHLCDEAERNAKGGDGA